jgi:hypothetical protein
VNSTDTESSTSAELVSSDGHGELWRAGRGSLALRWTEGGAIYVRGETHGDRRLTSPAVRRKDAVLAKARRVRVFYDFWEMPTYDSEMRTEWTRWLATHRASLDSLHVLARSKLVLMGVSVANLALGGIVRTHSTREPFDAQLRAAGIDPR